MNYTYDGSFLGYVSVVFDAYHDGIGQTGNIIDAHVPTLFDEAKMVSTDAGKAQRVLDGLRQQCGGKTCHYLYYAFLAEQPEREQALLTYIRLAFRYKQDFLRHLHEPSIWEVRQWARKAGNERHKLLGLLRFRELDDGMLYSRVAPDSCVVPAMAPHFVRRLAGERWVIHDSKRGLGVYYDGHEPVLVEIPAGNRAPALSSDEEAFSALWKKYYRTVAIKERINPDLRRQFMPKKYWKNIIEVS